MTTSATILVNRQDTNCKQVNANITVLDNDSDSFTVQLTAWHYNKEDDFYNIQIENVSFSNIVFAESFIEDFTEDAATKFVNAYDF